MAFTQDIVTQHGEHIMTKTITHPGSFASRLVSSRLTTLFVVCFSTMAAVGVAPESFAADAETSDHRLVVVNNTSSNIYFSDYTQYRRPGDLINTWNDVDSVYNNELIGNDPDYLAPGEVSSQCGVWIESEVDPDCEEWYLETFSRYEDMSYIYNPWTTGDPLIEAGFDVLSELPRPFRIRSVFVEVADFQWRIQYGCDSASNNEDNWPSSPTFNWQTATVHSVWIDQDWPWVDYWEPTTLVVAIINDCNGDVSWGYNYWDAAASSIDTADGYWTDWINNNDGETDAVGDTEPVGCAEPVDIQCKLVTGQESMDRLPSLTTDTYSCAPQTGFSCTHADQADGSCGDWAVRFFCNHTTLDFDKELATINANTIAGGDLKDGSLVSLHLSGADSGTIDYQVKSSETSKYVWTAQLSHTINAQFEYSVVAGEWQGTTLAVLGSQYRNKVWGPTWDTSASFEVVTPRQIGQISGSHLSAGNVVRLRVLYGTEVEYEFYYIVPTPDAGKNWRWPAALARIINEREDSTPVRAGEYSGTALTYPGSSYRNKVWLPDEDSAWNIVIEVNPR